MRLSEAQSQVVEYDDGPLLVLAGPGAGKTRVLTERVRRLLDVPDVNYRVLALTFTNKAASEMKARVKNFERVKQRAFIGTLHAFCMEVLANRGKPVGINGLPHIFESFEDRKTLLREAVEGDSELRFALADRGDHRDQERALSDWMAAIAEFKRNLIVPSMVMQEFDRRFYEGYNAQLQASGGVDFDDLLLLAYRLFEEHPKVGRFYRRQYRYICVDEAQDLNEAQYRVLCALCADEHRNIMLVGDPRQAIYTWNGADPKYLDLFVRDFGAETRELTDNFRNSRTVVRAAQVLEDGYEVIGQLPIEGEVNLRMCASEEEEAEFVLDTISRLQQEGHRDVEGEIDLSRIAVLGRNKFVFSSLIEQLSEREWPHYQKMSLAAHEFVSDVVQEFELALRVVANPHDRVHLGMLASRWNLPTETEALRARFRGEDPALVLCDAAREARCGNAAVVAQAVRLSASGEFSIRLPEGLQVLEEYSASCSVEEREVVTRDVKEWTEAWGNFLRARPGGGQHLASFPQPRRLGDNGASLERRFGAPDGALCKGDGVRRSLCDRNVRRDVP